MVATFRSAGALARAVVAAAVLVARGPGRRGRRPSRFVFGGHRKLGVQGVERIDEGDRGLGALEFGEAVAEQRGQRPDALEQRGGEPGDALRSERVGGERRLRHAVADQRGERPGDAVGADPAGGERNEVVRLGAVRITPQAGGDRGADDLVDARLVGVDGERRMDARLGRVGGKEPVAERVDGRHPQPVDRQQQAPRPFPPALG